MPADDDPQSAPSAPPGGPPKKKRPRGSNKCQRTMQYMVRCTPVEHKNIADYARAVGLRAAAYLRGLGLKGDPGERAKHIPLVENVTLKALRGDLGRLNNNVNQIAKRGNAGFPVDLPELRQVLMDYPFLRDAAFKALGKEPSPEIAAWDEVIALAKDALQANPTAETVTLAVPARLLLSIVSGKAATAAVPPPKGRK